MEHVPPVHPHAATKSRLHEESISNNFHGQKPVFWDYGSVYCVIVAKPSFGYWIQSLVVAVTSWPKRIINNVTQRLKSEEMASSAIVGDENKVPWERREPYYVSYGNSKKF